MKLLVPAIAFFGIITVASSRSGGSGELHIRNIKEYPAFKDLFPVGMYMAAERMADSWSPGNLNTTHIGRPMIETYRRDLEDMARHHMNVTAIENTSLIPVPILRQMLKEGVRTGILMWASENGLPEDDRLREWARSRQSLLKDEPGLLAWSPWDEPYPEQMERWLKVKAIFEEADPNHPVIAVTCGGPKGFEKYSIVQAYDYYPVTVENPDPWSIGPMVARYVNEGFGRPIWFVQQAFQGEGRRLPSKAENRMMTYIALANGAKGIFYFIYDHVTDPMNRPTPLWEDIGIMAMRLSAIGPELLETSVDRRSDWISLITRPNRDSHRPKDMPSAEVSVLKAPDGRAFVIVHNTSVEEPASLKLAVTAEAGTRKLWDLDTLVFKNRDPAGLSRLNLLLEPGDGRIFLLSDAGLYRKVADRVRKNRFREELRIFRLDRELARAWGIKLSGADALDLRSRKASLSGKSEGALRLIILARNSLSAALKSEKTYASAKTALDDISARIAAFGLSVSGAESASEANASAIRGTYWHLVSSYLALQSRLATGDRTVGKDISALRSELASAEARLP